MTKTIPALISAAKALKAKAEKAEQYYVALGKVLAELKERKPKGITWPDFVKKHFGYSQQRADELIRVSVGSTTVTKLREQKRTSVKKTRANPTLRSVGSKAKPDGEVVRFDQFKNRNGVVKSACDFNDEDPDDVADPGDTEEMTRRQIFLNMVNATIEKAKVLDSGFFNKAASEEATNELFVETDRAIAAWSAVLGKLKMLQGATGKEQASGKKAKG